MTDNPLHQTHVLIIGAGIGGLVLAQGLVRNNIRCTVFERDATSDYRAQGYRIKMPPDVASQLRSCLDDARWTDFEQTCAETSPYETLINPVSGQVERRRGLRPGASATCSPSPTAQQQQQPYTVDRAVFRAVLLRGLEGIVHFGRELVRYEHDVEPGPESDPDTHTVTAFFSDGTSAAGTLLVGADGTRSKVRRQALPDRDPVDTQSCCIWGKTALTPELLARLAPGAGDGFTWAIEQTPLNQSVVLGNTPVALILERVRFPASASHPDYLYWVLTFRRAVLAPGREALDALLARRAPAELARELARDWHPSVRCAVDMQDERHTLYTGMQSMDPDMPPWPADPRVTFVGDSIHAMTATGGMGAVAAVRNAAVLVDTIAGRGVSAASMASYEDSMRRYAHVAITRSFQAGAAIINQAPFKECAAEQAARVDT